MKTSSGSDLLINIGNPKSVNLSSSEDQNRNLSKIMKNESDGVKKDDVVIDINNMLEEFVSNDSKMTVHKIDLTKIKS